jgi:UDP-N-acetylglucosamine kinase
MQKFSQRELELEQEALDFVLDNKDSLINHFVKRYNPLAIGGGISLFMAGSPGAGKTEFVRRYIPAIFEGKLNIDSNSDGVAPNVKMPFIHIDVDEIRTFIPQYRVTDLDNNIKGNAEVVQKAANKGLDIIRDYCFKNDISFLHDGTFSNYSTMKKLITKSLEQNRIIHIYYVYLDPIVAWRFTVAREYTEGRNILKNKFIDQFFQSQQNIIRAQKDFKDRVNIHVALKNNDNKIYKYEYNIQNVESYLEGCKSDELIKVYTPDTLQNLIDDIR